MPRRSPRRRRLRRAGPRPDLGRERPRDRRRRDIGDLAHNGAPHKPAALGHRDAHRRVTSLLFTLHPVVGGRERRQVGRSGRTMPDQHGLALGQQHPEHSTQRADHAHDPDRRRASVPGRLTTAHRPPQPLTKPHRSTLPHPAYLRRPSTRCGPHPFIGPAPAVGSHPLTDSLPRCPRPKPPPRDAVPAAARPGPAGGRPPAHAPGRPDGSP